MQDFIDRITDILAGMTRRDRLLLGGLVLFFGTITIGGSMMWAKGSLATRHQLIVDREDTLHKIRVMAIEHEEAQALAASIEAKLTEHSGTDLSSFMEQASRAVGIQDRLDSVRQKSQTSEGNLQATVSSVSLSKLSLEEMANLIYEMETSDFPLRIQNLKAKARKKGDEMQLSLSMDIAAYTVLDVAEESDG
jgi:hypothetical protein